MSNPTANVLYSTPDSRLDTVGSFTENQIEVWMMIRSANAEYREQFGSDFKTADWLQWLNDQWGIRIRHLDLGLDKNYEIVDEEKFLMFVLKYK